MRRIVTVVLLAGYAFAVAAVTIFPIRPHPSSYWEGEPWWTMFHYVPFAVDAASFILNIIMFVPFGVLVPLLRRRADSVRRLAGLAFGASATIELSQLVLGLATGSRRTVDVNDLIANTAGAVAGLLVLRLAVPEKAHRAMISRPAAAGRAASGGRRRSRRPPA